MDLLVVGRICLDSPLGQVLYIFCDPWVLLHSGPKSNSVNQGVFFFCCTHAVVGYGDGCTLISSRVMRLNMSFSSSLEMRSWSSLSTSSLPGTESCSWSCLLGMILNNSYSVSAINGQHPYTKQYKVTPKAHTSMAFVMGGLEG